MSQTTTPAAVPGDPAEPREGVGRLVRQLWVEWAREQPAPKPSWLLPWEEIDDGQREVDMRIGAFLFEAGQRSMSAQPATSEPAYRCGQCGASGCRLFRPYQNVPYPGSLRCAACAAASQGIDDADLAAGQIGWYVLAVPTTPGYDSFWGYTSVPDEPLAWWLSLPVKPTAAGGAS